VFFVIEPPSLPTASMRGETYNSPERIAFHRALSYSERLRLTIEAEPRGAALRRRRASRCAASRRSRLSCWSPRSTAPAAATSWSVGSRSVPTGSCGPTRDLDIVCAPQPENMDRVADCLGALGAEHPVAGTLSGASPSSRASFKLHTRHGDVQVVLNRMPGVPPLEELHGERILVRISPDAVAPVCSLAHLRAMKRAAGHPRNLADLAELDELHGGG